MQPTATFSVDRVAFHALIVAFKGQTEFTPPRIRSPQNRSSGQAGRAATGALIGTTPWQPCDNGLALEVFEGGRKVADGTPCP
jgi:hypothetical protein